MKISGGKLAEGRIQCRAQWVGVLRKRCLMGFFGFFFQWKPLKVGIDCPGPQLWAVRAQVVQGCVGGAVWGFLAGGGLVAKAKDQQLRLGQHLSSRDPPPRTDYFKTSGGWGAGARSVSCLQTCWVPLFPTYVGHDRLCPLNFSSFLWVFSLQPLGQSQFAVPTPQELFLTPTQRGCNQVICSLGNAYISFTVHFCRSLDVQEYFPSFPAFFPLLLCFLVFTWLWLVMWQIITRKQLQTKCALKNFPLKIATMEQDVWKSLL